ncbi:hypothetical protein Dimus_017904 [Dionaea muscipula]
MEDAADDTKTNRKHQAMLERLSKRNQFRLHHHNGDSTTTATSSPESTGSFLSRFSDLKQSITSQLSIIQRSPESFTKPDLDAVSVSIADLDKILAENSYHLPPYEVRASLKSISDLKESVEALSSQLFPKKKFSFKNKGTASTPKESLQNLTKPERIGNPSLSSKLGGLIGTGFRNREGEVLAEDFEGKEIGEFTVSDMGSCDVKLKGRSRAIFVHRLRSCKVYAGPVLGSILIEDVKDCVFVLASHQIRIHNAEKCDFYLRVRSRPIIEDSHNVRFAPYCLQYNGIEEDLRESRLDEETGNWENVDDFKWLRAVQSPNWSVLPEKERISTFSIVE